MTIKLYTFTVKDNTGIPNVTLKLWLIIKRPDITKSDLLVLYNIDSARKCKNILYCKYITHIFSGLASKRKVLLAQYWPIKILTHPQQPSNGLVRKM